MNIDVVMLAYTKDQSIKLMTDNAIKSLHSSSTNHTFNISVIESYNNPDIAYDNATVFHGTSPFNYNRNLNLGISKGKSDWVVICNNDLIFTPGWIEEILKVNTDSASPICPNWQFHKQYIGKVVYGYDSSYEVAGWCIVVKRSVLEAIGGFDEKFYFYAQDTDYGLTLKYKGFKHAIVGTSRVIHLLGQSSKDLGSDEQVILCESELILRRKWISIYPNWRRRWG